MLSRTLLGSLLTLTIFTLLLALLTSAPVNCVCNPSQHLGHAVHSILPHHHDGEPTEAAASQTDPPPLQPLVASLVGNAASELLAMTAVSPPLPAALLGLLLLPLLSQLRPRLAFERPREHLRGPPTEPPR